MVEAFENEGDVNTTFARLAAEAPDVKQAEAKLEVAKRDLDQAELDLRYCDVFAEIDGVITRRNVNPGDNIQVGQALMAIRSLNEIWVDANFKETQLGDLRIGQPVDLYVDMYGGRHVFEGRISGFTEGTGSTLALLPAENATGNFVKVVQRLPVRIDLTNYDPDKKSPVHRHVGYSLRLLQQAAHRTRRREVFADICASIANRRSHQEPAGRKQVTVAALSPARPHVARNPWVVAVVVVVPAFMEVLDTTIALVALRYIAGGLSAAADDAEWVITSYLAANAFILPITGWLSAHLGRRNYFLASIAIFTLSSLLCGLAGSLASADPVSRHPGSRGRRSATRQSGDIAGRLPAGKARRSHDAVRLCRADRAHRRPDLGRLDNGHLQLALGIFDQRARRSVGLWRMLLPA